MVQIDFKILISHAGSEEGARILFQRLITALVKVKYKDAREIRPSPGDWGIDVIVGNLTDICLVWQAKYFIDSVGDSQKKQIRESFNQLMKKSNEKKFTIHCWTLCIPCSLSPDERQWWEKWKKRNEKTFSTKIELMDETDIRTELESPDAKLVKMGYFGPNPSTLYYFLQALKEEPERDIQSLPEPGLFEDSLFIKKLRDGGIQELYSAKTQFFNAELLTQEIFDKRDIEEELSIRSLNEKLRSMWETRFNEACTAGDENFKSLYPSLMKAIEQYDKEALKTPDLKATFIHKQGIVHQMANKCEVGWTKNFRDKIKSI